jgi:c-di-GMP-binding flagellar brake protein YcgR
MDTDKTPTSDSRQADVSKASRPAPTKRDRRTQARYPTAGLASIVLIKSGSVLRGTIQDLSLSGCHILCHEKFPVGIYTRVQIDFYLEGMSFLLAGVVQAIYGPKDVGIRFLDISSRKRDQIQQLIQEIEETLPMPLSASEGSAEPPS